MRRYSPSHPHKKKNPDIFFSTRSSLHEQESSQRSLQIFIEGFSGNHTIYEGPPPQGLSEETIVASAKIDSRRIHQNSLKSVEFHTVKFEDEKNSSEFFECAPPVTPAGCGEAITSTRAAFIIP
jgi:hypothetical protein